jgi:tRNA(adenine34) deaminase
VPIGAVLVADTKVIGEGWNCPIASHDPSHHAEIAALRQAGQRTQNYRFPGSTLYVTVEPCVMCAGALTHARIDKVIFGAYEPRTGGVYSLYQIGQDTRLNHQYEVVGGFMLSECAQLMQAFFKARR